VPYLHVLIIAADGTVAVIGNPGVFLAPGWASLLLVQIVGFLLACAGWWLAKR
jgi:hypothetical protein